LNATVFSTNSKLPASSLTELLSASPKDNRLGGFLPITDDFGFLVGVVTDSDYRKFSGNLDSAIIGDLMNKSFISLRDNLTFEEMVESLLFQVNEREEKGTYPLTYIPILDESGRLIKVIHILDFKPLLDEVTQDVFVFGLGFVGLTLSIAMASAGLRIIGVEKSVTKLSELSSGSVYLHEPFVEQTLKSVLNKNFFATDFTGAVKFSRGAFGAPRTFIIAVGTPIEKGTISLEQITECTEQISKLIKFGDLVILRSTVPLGVTRNLVTEIIRAKTGLEPGVNYSLAFCPERTVEGNAVREIRELPQLVGGFSNRCAQAASSFFSKFVSTTIVMESIESCELAKLASNAYRDVVFGFANELSLTATECDIDINRMIKETNAGYDRNSIPTPSPGVGGPCLTKDSWLLSQSTEHASIPVAARKLNEKLIQTQASKILETVSQTDCQQLFAIGLAFKGVPETKDMRNSTAIELIENIRAADIDVQALDALITPKEIQQVGLSPLISFNPSSYFGILVLNNHPKNKLITFDLLEKTIQVPWLYDPWDLFDNLECEGRFKFRMTLSKKWIMNNE
jgi:UDP-N-acetyl-D-mannosaminuronic acid dehydrogenase